MEVTNWITQTWRDDEIFLLINGWLASPEVTQRPDSLNQMNVTQDFKSANIVRRAIDWALQVGLRYQARLFKMWSGIY
jgi:hypothetical protein